MPPVDFGTLPRKEKLILELLASEGPTYGLSLVERAGGALKRGTVYVTLGRMEAKGLVESVQEPLPPGAYFSLLLKHWGSGGRAGDGNSSQCKNA